MENPDLTKRELEVLKLIAQGLDNKGIIEKLKISYPTLQSHLTNIRLKLGISCQNSRPDVVAALWYIRNYGDEQC